MADPRFRDAQEPLDRDYLRERSGYTGRYNRSSAAEYEAAGEGDNWRGRNRNYDRSNYGAGSSSYGGGYGSSREGYGAGGGMGWRGDDYYRGNDDRDRGGDNRAYAGAWSRDSFGDRNYERSGFSAGRDEDRDYGRSQSRDYDRGGNRGGGNRGERGFFDRAGDEVRSWFGDEEAERRRQQDARDSDAHYHNWRSRQIADFDRDYDEYRRENAQKFDNEFGTWRTERQGQRTSLQRVTEHMDVVGSDGEHVGTVDKVRGDRIILTKSDTDAQGHHHSIPSRWIESVDDKVKIRKTAEEAKAHWRDEERSGAFFGEDRDQGSARSTFASGFSGTY